MSFDFDKTLQDMITAIKEVVQDDWDNIRGYAKQILDEEKETLKELAELRIRGKITDDELKSELDDEKDTSEDILNTLQEKHVISVHVANGADPTQYYIENRMLQEYVQKSPTKRF